jgi:hypothetical protein
MFVVITLLAQIQVLLPRSHVTVFTTSNVFHFGAVLVAAGILSAPWQALWPAGLLLGLAGLAGVTYMLSEERKLESERFPESFALH